MGVAVMVDEDDEEEADDDSLPPPPPPPCRLLGWFIDESYIICVVYRNRGASMVLS